jgi:hypothetical protein
MLERRHLAPWAMAALGKARDPRAIETIPTLLGFEEPAERKESRKAITAMELVVQRKAKKDG